MKLQVTNFPSQMEHNEAKGYFERGDLLSIVLQLFKSIF
jgi:hypothetical protein